MHEVRATVRNRHGLHARPAHLVVQAAEQFEAEVLLMAGAHTVSGRSIMGVMMLAAEIGQEVIICADGPDERAAVEAIARLFQEGFGEE